MPSPSVVEIYPSPMGLRAITQLRQNVESLLRVRKEDQKTLALAMGVHPTTLNKFLKGTRELQLKDLDAVADFFGIATYQLFQPGISALSERRVRQRRTGLDRRIGHQARALLNLEAQVDAARAHPGAKPVLSPTQAIEIRALAVDFDRRLSALLQAADPRRQAATLGTDRPAVPDRPRTRHRSAAGKV